MKKTFYVMVAVLIVVLLVGCGRSSVNDKDNVIPGELLKTEKVLPEDFFEIADQGFLIMKATNQEEFNEQWGYYQLSDNPLELDWDNRIVIFLGIFESGSCPFEFNYVALSEEKTEIIIHLESDTERPCTDDITPRTLVIVVDADTVSEVTHLEIFNYHGNNPRVEF